MPKPVSLDLQFPGTPVDAGVEHSGAEHSGAGQEPTGALPGRKLARVKITRLRPGQAAANGAPRDSQEYHGEENRSDTNDSDTNRLETNGPDSNDPASIGAESYDPDSYDPESNDGGVDGPVETDGGNEDGDGDARTTPVVLIIDDDPGVGASLLDLLDAEGIVAKTYLSAQEFLGGYDPEIPGCILLDVRMKAMSGLDLLERLRGDRLMMPVIMMSAHDDTPSTVRAMKGGALTFFKKPIAGQLLFDTVNEAIQIDLLRRREERRVNEVRRRYATLTKSEVEIMDMIVRGLTSKEMTDALPRGIKHKTVEAHRSNVMKKMKAKNVAHLVYLALILKLPVLDAMFKENFT